MIKDMLNKLPNSEKGLMGLFVLYLVLGLQMPSMVATMIDTMVGKLFIVMSALWLFAYASPLLGVLGLLVAYQLIRQASIKTGIAALEEYAPTEAKKWSPFTSTNQFPYTLEQEMVKRMTTQQYNPTYVKTPFRPTIDDTHDAASLLY